MLKIVAAVFLLRPLDLYSSFCLAIYLYLHPNLGQGPCAPLSRAPSLPLPGLASRALPSPAQALQAFFGSELLAS